jgi:hypothetical protein
MISPAFVPSDSQVGPRPARPAIDLGDRRRRLVAHRVYSLVDSGDRLRRFMESHIFAVWDFQSLLKAMQQRLTCTTTPWVPTPDAEARRLVNEIVVDEESDELPDGGFASHFELYLDAMREAGADTGPATRLIAALTAGVPLAEALDTVGAPPAAVAFVRSSFAVIESGSTHGIVAAFTYGREDVIPEMFSGLVTTLSARERSWGRFRYYLDRHIEHDAEKHGPACRRIMARLCGADAAKWAEAEQHARACLDARLALWDAIAADIERLPSGGPHGR